jgi:DNA invertase Pin-like site-specific DNA recombinase
MHGCRPQTMAQNREMQPRELRESCQHRGWELAGEYVDAGVSGAKDSRPELNRLNAAAKRRRFDAPMEASPYFRLGPNN